MRHLVQLLLPCLLTQFGFDPAESYRERRIEGWKVLIHQELGEPGQQGLLERATRLLEDHLYRVGRAVPAGALEALRKVPIWMERAHPRHPCMCYHPDAGWLREHDMNPLKAGAVEIANCENFLAWSGDQPWMVLHELAHAYHHQVLGWDHAGVNACFELARSSGLYDPVLHIRGGKERAYALTDAKEYFAEQSEAFFGANDFYPFVRAELAGHDPAMFQLLGKLWNGQQALISAAPPAEDPPARKIVFLAGSLDKGHPRGTHEYERSALLLKQCLDAVPGFKGLKTEVFAGGWPPDPAALDDASAIVVISSGSDRNEADHPLLAAGRLEILEKQMKRGCGLALLHWSTFIPQSASARFLDWVGGYFDYQTGADHPQKWHSRIQDLTAAVKPGTPDHAICRGVAPFQMHDEFYYRLRFREQFPAARPMLTVAIPGEKDEQTVAWALERPGGGRGFGLTGGHYFENWWNPGFRKLVLNAIAWTAGLEVPDGGVGSELKEPFKTLIVTGHNHPAHDWRATTRALGEALAPDWRFQVEVMEDPELMAKTDLSPYRLLIFNYANWERPGLSEAARARFQSYLSSGGGLAIIHFANGAFHHSLPNTPPGNDWPEYRIICRRVWDHAAGKSGHDAYGPFHVDITRVKHPITEGLAAFDTTDELYFLQQGDLPIEPLATARSKTTGEDEPLAFAYFYGKGRVFQTLLGHDAAAILKAAELIRRGCAWASEKPG